MRLLDLTGHSFGRLLVVSRSYPNLSGGKHVAWRCDCACGRTTVATTGNLRFGHTTSCGCWRSEFGRRNATHGETVGRRHGELSAEYRAWLNAKNRCLNEKCKSYKDYGGRGIKMHPQWSDDFAAFLRDMGRKPSPALSIDRIDNDGDYAPGNCRWATRKEQSANRRNCHVGSSM